MTQTKATDPQTYMGVFKYHDEVPDRYRLAHHTAAYDGRDVWGEWLEDDLFENISSKRDRRLARNVGAEWATHCSDRGRHPALARPDDVETWFTQMLDELAIETVYSKRYIRLERFFSWLQSHAEHPHLYHPVWMAAATYDDGATGRLWKHKIDCTRQ